MTTQEKPDYAKITEILAKLKVSADVVETVVSGSGLIIVVNGRLRGFVRQCHLKGKHSKLAGPDCVVGEDGVLVLLEEGIAQCFVPDDQL